MRELFGRILAPTTEQVGFLGHEVEEHKDYPMYVLSCFFFSVAGYYRMRLGYPIEGLFLFGQTGMSLMSDVVTMGRESVWHLLDRYYAVMLTVYMISNLKRTVKNLGLNGVLILLGCYYLKSSQNMYMRRDRRFLRLHTIWHGIIPMLVILQEQ